MQDPAQSAKLSQPTATRAYQRPFAFDLAQRAEHAPPSGVPPQLQAGPHFSQPPPHAHSTTDGYVRASGSAASSRCPTGKDEPTLSRPAPPSAQGSTYSGRGRDYGSAGQHHQLQQQPPQQSHGYRNYGGHSSNGGGGVGAGGPAQQLPQQAHYQQSQQYQPPNRNYGHGSYGSGNGSVGSNGQGGGYGHGQGGGYGGGNGGYGGGGGAVGRPQAMLADAQGEPPAARAEPRLVKKWVPTNVANMETFSNDERINVVFRRVRG